MKFLSTLEQAHSSLKALEKQLDSVEEHARRMAGPTGVIPFDPKDEQLRKRYGRYANAVDDLGTKMRAMEHRLPNKMEYKNILGWALAFDEISRG